jgi:tRNA G18 (ribose-2'-O)-methylase SpoU
MCFFFVFSLFHLPLFFVNVEMFDLILIQVIGTSLSGNSIDTVPLEAPTILVLGNEGRGMRPDILKKCSHLVKINGHLSTNDNEFNVDSLNVSVSGGILLYHILKKKV